jgi:hypothetical protein
MPSLYQSMSAWFVGSKIRAGALAAAVLASLVWLGVRQAQSAATYPGVVALIWCTMLAVVWFSKPSASASRLIAWCNALVLDLFFAAAFALLVRGG